MNQKVSIIKSYSSPMSSPYFVYIVQCSDGSYYIGITINIEQRLLTHRKSRGARYTAMRLPIVLVHTESFSSQAQALHRESQLKKWTHAKKHALIQLNVVKLRELSKSRD